MKTSSVLGCPGSSTKILAPFFFASSIYFCVDSARRIASVMVIPRSAVIDRTNSAASAERLTDNRTGPDVACSASSANVAPCSLWVSGSVASPGPTSSTLINDLHGFSSKGGRPRAVRMHQYSSSMVYVRCARDAMYRSSRPRSQEVPHRTSVSSSVCSLYTSASPLETTSSWSSACCRATRRPSPLESRLHRATRPTFHISHMWAIRWGVVTTPYSRRTGDDLHGKTKVITLVWIRLDDLCGRTPDARYTSCPTGST